MVNCALLVLQKVNCVPLKDTSSNNCCGKGTSVRKICIYSQFIIIILIVTISLTFITPSILDREELKVLRTDVYK